MKIIKAQHLGMCFGVRDAIALARARAQIAPLTILGDLVHNPTVLGQLRAEGIQVESDPARVGTRTAMVTAHGASAKATARARAHGLDLFEGTCPLVRFAHDAIASLVSDGFHPVIIGRRGHVEVRGLTEDLDAFDLVETEKDVENLPFHEKIGVMAQTTQPMDRVQTLVKTMQRQFPSAEIRFIDTVCQPTKLRQRAALDLAQTCDVVIVVGGAQSNNTRELAATCAKHCPAVHQVESAADLRPEWFAGAQAVGVTAGTSTPDEVIAQVEQVIKELA